MLHSSKILSDIMPLGNQLKLYCICRLENEVGKQNGRNMNCLLLAAFN